ncbi:MAG: GNAT family N-acetyltransferase, partial [Pseudomonadota bacterium]
MRTKLRAATKTDAPFGLAVEEACMRNYAMALWGAWRPSATLENWDPAGQEVVTEDGHAIGLVATGLEEGFQRIKKLYLAPEHQNQGLGREVLDVICQRGFDQGLEVR